MHLDPTLEKKTCLQRALHLKVIQEFVVGAKLLCTSHTIHAKNNTFAGSGQFSSCFKLYLVNPLFFSHLGGSLGISWNAFLERMEASGLWPFFFPTCEPFCG